MSVEQAGRRGLSSRSGALPIFLFCALAMLCGSYIFLSYWDYSRMYYQSPQEWSLLLAGKGPAPFQYRLGVLFPADTLGRLFPHYLPLRLTITILDCVFLVVAMAALFYLISRRKTFRVSSIQDQWGLLLLVLFLLTFNLFWTLWYHQPETIANLFCLTGSLLLCARHPRMPAALAVMAMVVLALYGATVRADSMFAFHVGMLLACIFPGKRTMPLGRVVQGCGSFLSVGGVLATEYYIKNVLYPRARYQTALFQLRSNLHPANIGVDILAFAPYAATLWLATKAWSRLAAWERGLVLGSIVEFGLFMVVGRNQEVRIFIPFAMTLLALSAPLLHSYFTGAPLVAEEQAEDDRRVPILVE